MIKEVESCCTSHVERTQEWKKNHGYSYLPIACAKSTTVSIDILYVENEDRKEHEKDSKSSMSKYLVNTILLLLKNLPDVIPASSIRFKGKVLRGFSGLLFVKWAFESGIGRYILPVYHF